MTVETSDSFIREETEKNLRVIDAWAARMEPLLKMIADNNAALLRIIAEQERLRQPPEKRP
jgi:hypothetical protein